jgi:phosphoenolpyruvate-protein kinase (PTS system EI component)
LNREDLPDEEEHYRTYRQLAESVHPGSVTIRTLDIGGDKFLSSYQQGSEPNPAMGLRAIRFSLKEVEIFKIQLRGSSVQCSRQAENSFPTHFRDQEIVRRGDSRRSETGINQSKDSL